MRTLKALSILAILLFLPLQVLAETYKHPSGFSITIPDDWNVNPDGESFRAADPSGLVQFVFTNPENNDVEAVAKNVGKELRKIMKNVTEGETGETDLNNLKVFYSDMTGTIDGVEVTGLVYAFVNKKGRIMLAFAFVPTQSFTKQKNKISQILSTIKGI
jgi:hypothetical protein